MARFNPRLAVALLVFAAGLAAGCGFRETSVGNTFGQICNPGQTCTCAAMGNCEISCPDGDCHFESTGISNSVFGCAGGGCTFLCGNTGNCIADCAGGGCTMTCTGTGNCILSDCSSGCTQVCQNTGTCTRG